MKWKILIVDDEPVNLELLRRILKDDFRLGFAKDGKEALRRVHEQAPDLILLDIMMPGMSGYEVCRVLKSDPGTSRIPVIFVSALDGVDDEKKGLDLGAADYIYKPVRSAIVKARVRNHLALYDQQRACEQTVKERTAELNRNRLEVIRRLGRAAEYKDNETGMHVMRISHYSEAMARHLGWSDDARELILQTSPMHDVGKIGIPDTILLKPGPLNDNEWKIMKTHPYIGVKIIGDQEHELFESAGRIAFTHHEKWNGTGYPRGLRGDEIPMEGRIVAVADVFDALTTARPYKDAWPVERAVDLLKKEAGAHFDPGLIGLFLEILPEILEIRERWAEVDQTA